MSLPTTGRFKLKQETKLTFLHYLRYLLRECTYLPDPAARQYFHSHILERFRQYRPRRSRSIEFSWPSKTRVIQDVQRQNHLFRSCRKFLYTLHRANKGDQNCLTRVLYLTYGRAGKRRHQLLQPYLQPGIPETSDALRKLATATADPIGRSIPRISEAIEVIAKAQKTQPSDKLSRPPIRRIQPVIAKTNKWGRPMPLKRVRNTKKRAYNDLLEKILPPLPEEEWTRLRDLTTGRIPFRGPTERRGSASPLSDITVHRPHQISGRFMRRLWRYIFCQCPTMKWDTVKGMWNLRWESLEEATPPAIEADAGEDAFLFESTQESNSPHQTT